MNPIIKFTFLVCIIFASMMRAQVLTDEEELKQESRSVPKAIDFSKMFEDEETSRQNFEEEKQKRETELRQKMMQAGALEKAIDPDTYIVGPGDMFMFNIWGAMEMQIPVVISPEGSMTIPSVGEINLKEMTLTSARQAVLNAAKPYYQNSQISLSLESLRSFRVHVVGEVKYPGTYLANPTERIYDMIEQAGGTSDWANKLAIELRTLNQDTLLFNMAEFESQGDVNSNLFVHGGDMVFVPTLNLSSNKIFVDGDFKVGGLYQILKDESVYGFLNRIGAFNKNTNPSDIVILRNEDKIIRMIKPFSDGNPDSVILQNGDRITIPSAYVYVKGSVQFPGTYPYVAAFTAKDYAGMAGGNYQSGSIKNVKVYQAHSGKMKRGPDAPVAPGDVVDLPISWGEYVRDYAPIVSALTSVVLAARAIGLIGN